MQRAIRGLAAPSLSLAMIACGSSSGTSQNFPGSDSAGDANAMLCASSDCGSSTRVATIPDAENILFTDDGRLFVTGDLAYEITRDGEGFTATPAGGASCAGGPNTEFFGLAQRGDVIYSPCNTNPPQLFAAFLAQSPNFVPIYQFENASFPNGVATDNQGRLYIANGPLSPPPVIIRLTFDPNDPMNVIDEEVWLDRDIESPNGMAFDGSGFFITDSSFSGTPGLVKRVALNADGSAGEVETIFTSNGVLDDLSIVDGNRLLVGDFTQGLFNLIDRSGNLIAATDPGTYRAASAVVVGQPPLFSETDILVTDKGVLGERDTPVGNSLEVFRADP